MYSDYIITVDENGEPYIAHWFGLGHRNPPKNHKYVAKIKTPRGIRYFYTNADLKAYYFNRRVKNKIRGLFGKAPEINRPSSHQKNITGTAKEDSLKLRSTTGASELNALRENYEKTKADYNRAQLGINKRSGQEKLSYQNAMKNAEKEYLQKRDDIGKKLDQRLSSNGYTKKRYPTGNSSGINSSMLISDSRSAGVDRKFIEEYQNAVSDYNRAYKTASEKYKKNKNSSGVQSLNGRMPWNDPAVEAANRRKSDLEELLVQALYDEKSLPSFYKKK